MIIEIKAAYIQANKALATNYIKISPAKALGPNCGTWGNGDYTIDHYSVSKNQVNSWFEAMVTLIAKEVNFDPERGNVDEVFAALLDLEVDEPDGIFFEEPPVQKIKHEMTDRCKIAVSNFDMPLLDLETLVGGICHNDYYVFSLDAFYETRDAYHYFRHWMMD